MHYFNCLLAALCLPASTLYAGDPPELSAAKQEVANIQAGTHSVSAESRSTGAQQELVEAAIARHEAYAHGDCVKWARYVSADFHFIDRVGHTTTRVQEMKECHSPKHAVPGSNERVLTDFHCQIKGNLAFLDYRIDETQHHGNVKYTQSFRHLDIFERRQKKWSVIKGMQAQIFDDPLIAQVDPAYDAFVGQYELTLGMGDLITRQGDKLFGQDLQWGKRLLGSTGRNCFRRVPILSSYEATRLAGRSSRINRAR